MVQTLVFTLRDQAGRRSQMQINQPDAATEADINAFILDLAPHLFQMSLSAVDSITLTKNLARPPGLRFNPAASATNEHGALFVFQSDAGFSTRLRVPGFSLDLTDPASDQVLLVSDPSDNAPESFRLLMIGGNGTATPTDTRGSDIVSLVSAQDNYKNIKPR